MNFHKLLCLMLATLLLASLLSFPAASEEAATDGINASSYLVSYNANLSPSGTSGKIVVGYAVYATGVMTRVGVFKIQVYKANGTHYKTIWGSTGNGLLKANSAFKTGTYKIDAVSGTSYYCLVTVYAQNSSGSDSHAITTSTVVCP